MRNKGAAEKAFGEAVPKNLSFVQADITDIDALKVRRTGNAQYSSTDFPAETKADQYPKTAAAETARLTGGGLDYLVNNAAFVSNTSGFRTLGDL